MKAKSVLKALAVMALAAVWFGVLAPQDRSWIAMRYTDIDINSGDLREQMRICFVPIRSSIRQSPLSEEARRLGVDLDTKRLWKRAFEASLGPEFHEDHTYGMVISSYDLVLSLLRAANAPDADRRVVVEKLMTTLRTGTAHDALRQAHHLLVEIDRKYTLNTLNLMEPPSASEPDSTKARTAGRTK